EALRAVLRLRRRRLTRLATGAAVTAGFALLAFGAWQYQASRCRDGAGALSAFFGASAEDGWRRAWQNTKGTNLEGLTRFDALLRAFKEDWAQTHRAQCEATLRTPWATSPGRACLEEKAALLG